MTQVSGPIRGRVYLKGECDTKMFKVAGWRCEEGKTMATPLVAN